MRIAIQTKYKNNRIRAQDTYVLKQSVTIDSESGAFSDHRNALWAWVKKYQDTWSQYGNILVEIASAEAHCGAIFIVEVTYASCRTCRVL